MKAQSFRDVIAWQKSHVFCVKIYKTFENNRDYSFKDQIQRASVSIMNNIAEGHSKRSNKAFRNYLLISKGSASEVESMLDLALSLKYINESQYKVMQSEIEEISKILSGFVKSIDNK